MVDWPSVTISDVATVYDGPHATPKTVDSGPIFLGIGALQNGRINPGETRHVTPDDFKTWTKRVKPQENDVVFSYETRIGEAAIIPKGLECCLGRRMGLVRLKQDRMDPRFFLYVYISPQYQEFLRAKTIQGATVDRIALTEFPSFPLPLPPLIEQQAIASILGALDDKIELNRRTNETLEGMARALFKDWFVDFGPTRAKQEGLEPYLVPELWSLFPERLDAEGKPVGWSIGCLGEIAISPRNGVDPSEVHPGTPYIGLEHMPRRSIALSDWESADKVTSAKSAFQYGDFLFGKLRPYFHKVGVVPLDGICSTDIVVVRARKPEWRAFTIACISTDDFVAFTDRTSGGTKMPRTSWASMARYATVLPNDALAGGFESICWPLIERIHANIHESRTLAQTRDLLLPKLMSGEVRVQEIEPSAASAPQNPQQR